jgi:hypothetical protein
MLVQLVLADFGVSHRLSAVVEGLGPSAISAAGRAGTSLTGESLTCALYRCVLQEYFSTSPNDVVELSLVRVSPHYRTPCTAMVVALYHVPGGQALGPFQWQAPEVCKEMAVMNQPATLATTPSDVYMLGAY